VLDTLPVQVTDSRSNLGDLKQFIGVGAAPIVIKDISLFVHQENQEKTYHP
jgi:hypothetical protein